MAQLHLTKRNPSSRPIYQCVVLSILPLAVFAAAMGCSGQANLETDLNEPLQTEIATADTTSTIDVKPTSVKPRSLVQPADVSTTLDDIDISELSTDINFFRPPKTTAVQVAVSTSANSDELEVRFIGFINPNPADDNAALALLEIGNQIFHLRVGESASGVEVVASDVRNRSVTLQRKRDRWTLLMMEQPIVHQSRPAIGPNYVPGSRRKRTTTRGRRSSVSPRSNNQIFASPADPPPINLPKDFPIEMPAQEALPEMPELPEIEGLPEFL